MTNDSNSTSSEKKEILTELIGFEISKLKNTIKDLTLNPGIAIDHYAKGDRKKYLSPISYFLLIFGISFFLDSVTGVGDYLFNKGFNQYGESWATGVREAEKDSGKKIPFDVQQLANKVNSEAKDFFQRKEVQLIILLPGLLLCQWLFFKRSKSFLHNSYFALFTLGHSTLLLLPLTLLYFVSKNFFFYTYLVLGFTFPIVFSIYCGIHFYATDWKKLVVKNILLYISITIAAGLFTGFLGILAGVYTSMVHLNGG